MYQWPRCVEIVAHKFTVECELCVAPLAQSSVEKENLARVHLSNSVILFAKPGTRHGINGADTIISNRGIERSFA